MVSDTLAIAQKKLGLVSKGPTQSELDSWYHEGEKYFYGKGVPQNYEEAFRLYRKAADQGHAGAQSELAYFYYCDLVVRQDYNEALKWCQKAVAQDDGGAQYNLGVCYDFGHGVPEDKAEAVKWFYKAVGHGVTGALSVLAFHYENGWGVPQDYAEAYKWYKLYDDVLDKLVSKPEPTMTQDQFEIALHNLATTLPSSFSSTMTQEQFEDALHKLVTKQLLLKMSQEQIAEGERRYNDFKATHNQS